MFYNFCKFNIIYSKKNAIDLLILSSFMKWFLLGKRRETNNFVSLKSPFHYKLGKNHLTINSITLNLVIPNKVSIKSYSILGNLHSKVLCQQIKYNLISDVKF